MMNNLLSVIAVLAAVVAISSAMETPKVVDAVARAPHHSGPATHKYPMELMKKKMLTQLAKIQNSDMTEEAKQIAIRQAYDQFRKVAGNNHRTKTAKPGGLQTAARYPDMAQAAHLMHKLEMDVGGLQQQQQQQQQRQGNHRHNHAGGKMNGKRFHNGASVRQMAKGFADAKELSGMTRKRRNAPVKKLRQSIARAI